MEEIDLGDLNFDFEDYFQRHRRGELTDQESSEFDARVIGIFCRRMLLTANAGGEWSDWESFAAYNLAKKLHWVISGLPWRKAIDLPFDWGSYESDYTRTGQRAIDIFCAVTNEHREDSAQAITELIRLQADRLNISFETARADYYSVKRSMDEGDGFRPFLKPE